MLPLPAALATKGVTTDGRKLMIQKALLNTWLAAPWPAKVNALPIRPTKIVSTAPTKGRIAKFTTAGNANVKIRLSRASPHGSTWMVGGEVAATMFGTSPAVIAVANRRRVFACGKPCFFPRFPQESRESTATKTLAYCNKTKKNTNTWVLIEVVVCCELAKYCTANHVWKIVRLSRAHGCNSCPVALDSLPSFVCGNRCCTSKQASNKKGNALLSLWKQHVRQQNMEKSVICPLLCVRLYRY